VLILLFPSTFDTHCPAFFQIPAFPSEPYSCWKFNLDLAGKCLCKPRMKIQQDNEENIAKSHINLFISLMT